MALPHGHPGRSAGAPKGVALRHVPRRQQVAQAEEEATIETLTHTKRRDFLNCPRYYFNRHERRIVPKMSKGGYRRGTAFGNAIFACSENPGTQDDYGIREDTVRAAIDLAYEGISPSSSEEAQLLELEQIKVQAVVMGYLDRYGVEQGKREVIFDLPLVNPSTGYASKTFRRGGKIDGLRSLGNGRWRVIEDKLVGQIQKAMIDRLPLDAQASEYVDALLSLGLEAEISYRHTLLPGTKPRLEGSGKNRRRETLTEYGNRLVADIAERPEHYFDEQILVFPQDRLEDYRRGRWGTARKIMDARLLANKVGYREAFPMNPSRCWEYGGCEYIPLCTRGEDAIDLYVPVPDNPELAREETDGGGSEYPQEA